MTKEQILKFIDDPDWHFFVERFELYLSEITDLKSIDLNQPSEVIKAEIIVRNQTAELLRKFLTDNELLRRNSAIAPVSFK